MRFRTKTDIFICAFALQRHLDTSKCLRFHTNLGTGHLVSCGRYLGTGHLVSFHRLIKPTVYVCSMKQKDLILLCLYSKSLLFLMFTNWSNMHIQKTIWPSCFLSRHNVPPIASIIVLANRIYSCRPRKNCNVKVKRVELILNA